MLLPSSFMAIARLDLCSRSPICAVFARLAVSFRRRLHQMVLGWRRHDYYCYTSGLFWACDPDTTAAVRDQLEVNTRDCITWLDRKLRSQGK